MNNPSGKHMNPSNCPPDGSELSKTLESLESMSAVELADALERALDSMTEDSYNDALIDAYLDALDRKAPAPEFPDAETAYAAFQEKLAGFSRNTDTKQRKIFIPSRKSRRVWRTGLAAALAVVCMFGCMAVAQAAGFDVFGAVANWTDNVFSFGEITSDGAIDIPNDAVFASLQDALDAYRITEVSEPLWLPEGYTFKSVTVDMWDDGVIYALAAEYTNGTAPLHIELESCSDEPDAQLQKTDAPVETFAVGDTMVYLLENSGSNTAAWATEHYACYISGAVDKNELRKMALSAIGQAPEWGSFDYGSELLSLQDVLDAFAVTEVSAPDWIPERFAFSSVGGYFYTDENILYIAASYLNGKHALHILAQRYDDKPTVHIEKNDAPVETFEVGGTTVYLLENNKNNTAAWVTEHYECYIGGVVDKNELRKIVRSIYPNS